MVGEQLERNDSEFLDCNVDSEILCHLAGLATAFYSPTNMYGLIHPLGSLPAR